MKKILISLASIFLILIVSVCFYFSGKEYVYRFSEEKIQEKISEKLPLTKSYLYIFNITLANPVVSLKNDTNRVNVSLDVLLNVKLTNEENPLSGSITASGGIKYVPEKGEFFLGTPAIESLRVNGVPEKYNEKVRDALEKALEHYYSEHPIYKFNSSELPPFPRTVLERGKLPLEFYWI